uniref:PRD domain-containing protein n=1 Tax=Burkholderia vietnamiensis TaxID=60552 RepID=UPI001ABBAC4A
NSEELSMREMSLINQLINKSITIIESDLNHQVDQSSVQYQRFIRHVQFLIRRLRQNEAIHAQNDLIEMIKKNYPNSYSKVFIFLNFLYALVVRIML